MSQIRQHQAAEVCVEHSEFDHAFNRELSDQYQAAKGFKGLNRTHFFNGRYENIYLTEDQVPALVRLKADAKQRASRLLNSPVIKMGCWFNEMPPGACTTLHRHDDDDERLSGVYYVCVPENSGELIIHRSAQLIRHFPRVGQWVFLAPQMPHEVAKNFSEETRLSIAFNFSC